MRKATPNHIPVDLITGFLGSGKTTLLRHLLADPDMADTAVLINEFGEIGLDHLLLERIDEAMVLLQSGCLCCSIREELADAMKSLLSRRDRGLVPPFRRLVIESTGIADPFPILSTVHSDPVLKHHFRLGTVVTTIDAVNGTDQLNRQFESVKQIVAADRIVMTKTDLADAQTADRLAARITTINPVAPILNAKADRIDARTLLSRRDGRALDLPAKLGPNRSNVHGGVSSFALSFDHPLDWTAFGLWLTMLLNHHGDNILRVKGVLDVAGWDRPVALHGVQRLMHPPEHMRAWPNGERRSRIVFIVRGIERSAVERSLAAFDSLGHPQQVAAATA